jgi:hypothetical protein
MMQWTREHKTLTERQKVPYAAHLLLVSVQCTHADILWANEACGTRSDQNSTSFCSYAAESISLACKYAYRNATPGSKLAGNCFIPAVNA